MNEVLQRIFGPMDDVPDQVRDALRAFGEQALPDAPDRAHDLRAWAQGLRGRMSTPRTEATIEALAQLGSAESYKSWYNDVSDALTLLSSDAASMSVLLEALEGHVVDMSDVPVRPEAQTSLDRELAERLAGSRTSIAIPLGRWIRLVLAFEKRPVSHNVLAQGRAPKRRADLHRWTHTGLPADALVLHAMIDAAHRMRESTAGEASRILLEVGKIVTEAHPQLEAHLLASIDDARRSSTSPPSLLYLHEALQRLPPSWRIDVSNELATATVLRERLQLPPSTAVVVVARDADHLFAVFPPGELVILVDPGGRSRAISRLSEFPAWSSAEASTRDDLEVVARSIAYAEHRLYSLLRAHVDFSDFDRELVETLTAVWEDTPKRASRGLCNRLRHSPDFPDVSWVIAFYEKTSEAERPRQIAKWLAARSETAAERVRWMLCAGDAMGAGNCLVQTPPDDPAHAYRAEIEAAGVDLNMLAKRHDTYRRAEAERREDRQYAEEVRAPLSEVSDLPELRRLLAVQESSGGSAGIAIARAQLGFALIDAGEDGLDLLEDAVIELPHAHPVVVRATALLQAAGRL